MGGAHTPRGAPTPLPRGCTLGRRCFCIFQFRQDKKPRPPYLPEPLWLVWREPPTLVFPLSNLPAARAASDTNGARGGDGPRVPAAPLPPRGSGCRQGWPLPQLPVPGPRASRRTHLRNSSTHAPPAPKARHRVPWRPAGRFPGAGTQLFTPSYSQAGRLGQGTGSPAGCTSGRSVGRGRGGRSASPASLPGAVSEVSPSGRPAGSAPGLAGRLPKRRN